MASCRGKTALVTNASEAAGKAAAMALAAEGASVLIHDPHSAAKVQSIVEAIISNGGIARATTADAATPEGCRRLAQDARTVIGDRLDILVIDINAMDPEAPLFLLELLLPILTSGSSVIAIHQSNVPGDAVTVSLKQRAMQLKDRGIRLNALEADGFTDARRIGAAVILLATEGSSGMTGATIAGQPPEAVLGAGVPRGTVQRGSSP